MAIFPLSTSNRRLLVVVPTPMEAAAFTGVDPGRIESGVRDVWKILAHHPHTEAVDILVCGVGKVNAAGGTAIAFSPQRHAGILCIGIAGILPGSGLHIGQSVLATRSVYADEGLEGPGGFVGCAAMGFPLGPFEGEGVDADPHLADALREKVDAAGVIATVSTCAGTDALAVEVGRRTGATAEGMEGAAVGHVAARLGTPFAEIRVLSNTTGGRPRQVWDLDKAKGGLRTLGQRLLGE